MYSQYSGLCIFGSLKDKWIKVLPTLIIICLVSTFALRNWKIHGCFCSFRGGKLLKLTKAVTVCISAWQIVYCIIQECLEDTQIYFPRKIIFFWTMFVGNILWINLFNTLIINIHLLWKPHESSHGGYKIPADVTACKYVPSRNITFLW